MSVVKCVVEEMEVKFGSIVGYVICFEDCISKEMVIKYMIDGVLFWEFLNELDFDWYLCVIMDEVYERVFNIDVFMGLFKKIF